MATGLSVSLMKEIVGLKKKRSVAKGQLTRKVNEMLILMSNSGLESTESVTQKAAKVGDYFSSFLACHNKYHEQLTDPTDISDSETYYDKVAQFMHEYRAEFAAWVDGVADQISANVGLAVSCSPQQAQESQCDLPTSDASAKQLQRVSHVSSDHQASSMEEQILELEASILKDQQSIELKELQLRQKMEMQAFRDSRTKQPESKIGNAPKPSLNPRAVPFRPTAVQSTPMNPELMVSDIPRSQEVSSTCRPSVQVVNNVEIGESAECKKKGDSPDVHRDADCMVGTGSVLSGVPVTVPGMPPASVPGSELHQLVDQQSAPLSDTLIQILNQGQQQQQLLLNTLQLPKVDLMNYDGDPLKYWMFIRAFENAVDKEMIDDGAKLSRLLRYCTGKARRVIESCSVKEPSVGYQMARKLLKDRFGNDFVVSQAWVDRIANRKPIKASDNDGLRDLADDLTNCKETLASMGMLNILNQGNLVAIVDKLPMYLQTRWKRVVYQIRSHNKAPTIEDLVYFMTAAADEANDPVFGKCGIRDTRNEVKKPADKYKSSGKSGSGSSFSSQIDGDSGRTREAPQCVLCSESHQLVECVKFKTMKQDERWQVVKDHKLCKNCFKGFHFAMKCRKPPACTIQGCKGKHHKLMHISMTENSKGDTSKQDPKSEAKDAKGNAKSTAMSSSLNGAGRYHVALPIVPVRVSGLGQSKSVQTYALLDSGSNSTFCSDSLVRKLGLEGEETTARLTTLQDVGSQMRTSLHKLQVTDVRDDTSEVITLPQVLSRPSLHLEQNEIQREDLDRWPHLDDLDLPVVDTNKVELLIGQDTPEALVPLEVRRSENGAPYGIKTMLGWTINGPIGGNTKVDPEKSANFVESDVGLQLQVERFWKLDNATSDDQGMSIEDRKVIDLWDKTVKQEDGHYILPLPFKHRPPNLPDNESMARKRLGSLKVRLQKDPQLHDKYIIEMSKMLDKGYAEMVPEDETIRHDGYVWYLPHHPVFNPKKPGKTRIVFDCAAKCSGTSLNENVLQGPDLTNKLVGVLLRFRQGQDAFMADIEGMFNQVRVVKEDRDVLRFLWWDKGDLNSEPKVYRMTTHLFGGVWSPSAANYALKRVAEDHKNEYSLDATETVNKSFYVDDCLKGIVETSQDERTISLAKELLSLLGHGGFRLTKFISNNRALLKALPESELVEGVKDLDFDTERLPTERALGMIWDVQWDQFKPSVSIPNRPLTKRGMLSILSSVYDPLGLVSPYVLKAKMMFQELCRAQLGWDDEMSDDQQESWNRWCEDLPLLADFKVPRSIMSDDLGAVVQNQLHHFSDASQSGLGAASYIRQEDAEGKVHTTLVMAKAKLAPIKATTIPRLELAAAVESIKLDKTLRKELDIPIRESVFWTDSSIVLHYIANESKRFPTFVANRVAKIREHTLPSQWKHVPTEDNPADDVSRGLTADELVSNTRWIQGPEFLSKAECEWPSDPGETVIDNDDVETTTVKQVYASTSDGKKPGPGRKNEGRGTIMKMIEYHSDWYALKRSVAWMLRIKKFLHSKIQARKAKDQTEEKIGLTVSDLREAELAILKFVQEDTLSKENTKSNPLRKLNPVEDKGLLRVGGRLGNAQMSNERKHPIILPKKHHVVDLIIRRYHRVTGHSGMEHLLSEIRQRYWIVKGRIAIRRNLIKCTSCRKRNAQPLTQQMADLPPDRVAPPQAPFSHVGVDFFGPFEVKRGRKTLKKYGCIFTCLGCRAIHIETSDSLSTDSFINVLTRFMSRRGQPTKIRSDNGTNFVGAQRELKAAIKDWNLQVIEEFLRQKEIEWIFNPPTASHMGGVWERQIKTVRKVLQGLLGQQSLDEEAFDTLMCQVESIINSRPITKVSDDPNDLQPLTPNHLLLLRTGPSLPPGVFDRQDLYGRKRWRQVQYLSNVFWARWKKEYLAAMQQRQKWLDKSKNLSVDDVVLVIDDKQPRNQWLMGRVVEAYPGRDGLVRSVKLKTQYSHLVRPITKLCLIESAVGNSKQRPHVERCA